jgi:hypothetical protein
MEDKKPPYELAFFSIAMPFMDFWRLASGYF